jgi:hypothetical protein
MLTILHNLIQRSCFTIGKTSSLYKSCGSKVFCGLAFGVVFALLSGTVYGSIPCLVEFNLLSTNEVIELEELEVRNDISEEQTSSGFSPGLELEPELETLHTKRKVNSNIASIASIESTEAYWVFHHSIEAHHSLPLFGVVKTHFLTLPIRLHRLRE